MNRFIVLTTIASFMFISVSCSKENCKTCQKIVGGVAGNTLLEERTVCNKNKIEKLEKSSSGTTVWSCQ